MNTPSHLIITAALRKRLRPMPIPRNAFLLGSVMPDMPFWLLSIVAGLYFRYGLGWSSAAAAHRMFDVLYFHDPGWITAYNLLHSPTLLTTAIVLLWRFRRRIESPLRWLYWFVIACLLHSVIDIFTHVNDGPLLFFPFNWTMRFHSPISYWDPVYHGRAFTIFELALDVFLLLYLFVPSLVRRFRRRTAATQAGM